MCLEGCGRTVEGAIRAHLKDKYPFADIYISAEPKSWGLHEIKVVMYSNTHKKDSINSTALSTEIKNEIGFDVVPHDSVARASKVNWLNILVNLIAIISVVVLSIIFPPSLLLSLGLGALCFSATLFTARDYIFNFIKSLSKKTTTSMQATVSFGWLLALVHCIYHVSAMHVISSFAMTFMNYLMPLILVTIVNVMDEVKRQISLRSQKLVLNGLTTLFPQMRTEYLACELTKDELVSLEESSLNQDLVESKTLELTSRSLLTEGMIVEVKAGDCFPVNGKIVSGSTIVDKSIINGESTISAEFGTEVQSGFLNVWQDVKVLATTNAYYGTANELLFKANTLPKLEDKYPVIPLTPAEVRSYQAKDYQNIISDNKQPESTPAQGLPEHALVVVKKGKCFPADGYIVGGNVSLNDLNREVKKGCVNIWGDTHIFTMPSARKSQELLIQPKRSFYYLYFGLFALGFALSLSLSIVFGVFTVAILLQTMVGILFAICPCTIAISHYLPKLLQSYQISKQGIVVNGEKSTISTDDFDVFVFDKTGTLTGESVVHAVEGVPEALFAKIYQMEAILGRGHPIAAALQAYFKSSADSGVSEAPIDTESSASGVSATIGGELLCIGNADYLRRNHINGFEEDSSGFTPVYVARNNEYVGKILIKHELRPGMYDSLQKLHDSGKTLIMLTGDKETVARSFNSQFDERIFADDNIFADSNPDVKKKILLKLARAHGPQKVCFIGDGLNDALCSTGLREAGGTSISITANDKAAFFTDISLNGSLDYLFKSKQDELNSFERRIVRQNQWIMAFGALVFLVFLVSFPLLGIGISPLIPMAVMFSTTVFTLINSYRTQVAASNSLSEKKPSFLSRIMQSELASGLLVGGSLLLVAAVLVASLTSLHLALPLFVFSGGAATIASSSFLVAATAMLGGFAALACAHTLENSLHGCRGPGVSAGADDEISKFALC